MFLQHTVTAGFLRPVRKLGLAAAKNWPWPVRAQISTGRAMYVDLRSPIGRGIYAKGEFDPSVFDPLRSVLQPGDTFLDIGANVGYYSMLALDVIGPTGCVHAFEIDERPLRCLRKTKATERLGNLEIHAVAVGDRSGVVMFHEDQDSGHSHLATGQEGRAVPMTTLDDWAAQTKAANVRAVKMDIEGAEVLALRGARQFIAKHRPVWVCEAWDSDAGRSGAVGEFLQELGYRLEPLRNVHSPAVVAWPS